MTKSIDVSVIIRVRNESNALLRAFDSLDAQIFDGQYEVIVIDNESDDGSQELAVSRGAKVFSLAREMFTYGRAINLGVSRSRGSLLVLLSAHAWPKTTDWLQVMVDNVLSSQKVMGVFCKQVPAEDMGYFEALRFAPFSRERFVLTANLIKARLAEGQSLYEASYFSNSAVVLRKSATQQFLMRDLPYAEENAFALDCILNDMQVIYATETQIIYQGPVSVKSLYHQARRQMIAEKLIEHHYAASFDPNYHYWNVSLKAVGAVLLLPVKLLMLGYRIAGSPKYKSGSRARNFDYCALAGVWGRFVGSCVWRRHRVTLEVDHAMLNKADYSMKEISNGIDSHA